jgi:hypothetical protein
VKSLDFYFYFYFLSSVSVKFICGEKFPGVYTAYWVALTQLR